jgi:regulator of protease activity HflC (stomatin/prohibitin superfamily)
MTNPTPAHTLATIHRSLGGMARFLLTGGAAAAVLFLVILLAQGIVVVDNGKCAVLLSKTGTDLPSGEIIALAGQKGIQLDPLPEGWYWRNPYTWDWSIESQTEIPSGRMGVKIRNFGRPMPEGRVLAADGEKGIVREVLRPGRYVINPHAYTVKGFDAITIAPGHVGVVTLVSGKDPKNPNDFLVEPGERGVQKHTLPPGTYYPNPFEESITEVDIRSHRFDMTKDKIIKFPSLDGFDISMEGTIEWYIDPSRVAEVFVKYVDVRPIMDCIEQDVILPNTRAFSRIEGSKHLARDFIEGRTREKFQEEFLNGVKRSCQQQGVMIQSALVRQITPPDAIARPIKDREIAVRMRELYEQQKERERQQKLLSMEEKMKDRKTLATAAEADVSVSITRATQEKEVAIIEAGRQLEVARLQLQAAHNQAEAKVAEGRAKADVLVLKNAAEAQGLKNSVAAFGDGNAYVRYLMNQKLAPSLTYILSNTDGPFAELFQRVMEAQKTPAKPAPAEKK